MGFSLPEFEQQLNNTMKSKYAFIEQVDIANLSIRLGVLYGDFIIVTKKGTIKLASLQCKDKIQAGQIISFWTMATCFRKKINLVKIEKDIESTFWLMYGRNQKNIGVIKTEYIIN